MKTTNTIILLLSFLLIAPAISQDSSEDDYEKYLNGLAHKVLDILTSDAATGAAGVPLGDLVNAVKAASAAAPVGLWKYVENKYLNHTGADADPDKRNRYRAYWLALKHNDPGELVEYLEKKEKEEKGNGDRSDDPPGDPNDESYEEVKLPPSLQREYDRLEKEFGRKWDRWTQFRDRGLEDSRLAKELFLETRKLAARMHELLFQTVEIENIHGEVVGRTTASELWSGTVADIQPDSGPQSKQSGGGGGGGSHAVSESDGSLTNFERRGTLGR